MRIPASQTTTHLKPPRTRIEVPPHIAGALCTFALIAIAALAGALPMRPAAAVPTTMPAIIIYATAPARVPTPAPAQQVAVQIPAAPAPVRWVTAFAAPDGAVLGPVPAPADLSAIQARWGDAWVMVSWNDGPVWLRSADLGLSLANLAPQAPQLQPAPVYQVVNEVPAPVEQAAPAGAPQEAPQPPVDQRQAVMQVTNGAPAPQSAPAATPSLQEAVNASATSTAANPNGSTAWRLEHCIGSGATEVCTR